MDHAAAAVDEAFQLCADMEDIVGCREHEGVGLIDFRLDRLEVVLLRAHAFFVADVACLAGADRVAREHDSLDLGAGIACTLHNELEQPCSITLKAVGACQ